MPKNTCFIEIEVLLKENDPDGIDYEALDIDPDHEESFEQILLNVDDIQRINRTDWKGCNTVLWDFSDKTYYTKCSYQELKEKLNPLILD